MAKLEIGICIMENCGNKCQTAPKQQRLPGIKSLQGRKNFTSPLLPHSAVQFFIVIYLHVSFISEQN